MAKNKKAKPCQISIHQLNSYINQLSGCRKHPACDHQLVDEYIDLIGKAIDDNPCYYLIELKQIQKFLKSHVRV